ncbi:MAG: hypothetical protein UEP31_09080 [Anaerovoracaceae bacterium]|nr:hypothetical protein [Anaerovoracaceae bacterium]
MNVTIEDVEMYLEDLKEAINAGRYRIAMNENRQDNRDLFVDYVISEEQRKQILLSLEAADFSEIRHNTHKGYEHELLYVFGKDVKLLNRFGSEEEQVSLYIKFNKLESLYVIVILFHKQKYPLNYKFR